MQLAYLQKVVPADNQYRFYSIHVEPTLFGEWSVINEWGRIGQSGQTKIKTFANKNRAIRAGQKQIVRKEKRGYCRCPPRASHFQGGQRWSGKTALWGDPLPREER